MSNEQPLGNMIIEMNLSTTGFKNSLKNVQRAIKSNEQQMKAHMAVYDSLDDKIGKLEANYDGLRRSMDMNKDKLKQLQRSYQDEVNASGESSEASQKLAQQINQTIAQQAKYEAQINRVTNQLVDAKDGTDDLKKSISLLSAENRSIVASYRSMGDEMGALQADYNGLEQAVTERNKLIDKERQKLQRLKEQSGETSEEYRRQAIRLRELETSNNEARQAMNRLEGEMNDVQSEANQTNSSLDNMSEKFGSVGSRLMPMTAALGAVGGAFGALAISTSNSMDDIESRIQAMVKGTETQLNKIKKNIEDTYTAGLTTDLEETTNVAARIQQRGIKEKDQGVALDYATVLAKNTGQEANQIVDTMAMLQKKFGMGIDGAADYTQEIIGTGIEDLDQAMEYLPQLMDSGMSVDEIISKLRAGMSEGAWNSDKTLDLLAEGQKRIVDPLKDSETNIYEDMGLGEAFNKFHAGDINYSQFLKEAAKKAKGKNKTEKKLFWASILGTQGEDIDLASIDAIINAEVGKTKTGQAGDLVDAEKEKSVVRLTSAYNKLKMELQPVGTVLMNLGATIAERVLPYVEKFATWFGSLSTNSQIAGVGLVGFAAALGPIMTVMSIGVSVVKNLWGAVSGVFGVFKKIGEFLPSFSTIWSTVINVFSKLKTFITPVVNLVARFAPLIGRVLFTAFRALLGPIGWVLLAITGLTAGFKYAYTHSEKFRNFIDKLKTGVTNAWNTLKKLGVKGTVALLWTNLKNAFSNGWTYIKGKMTALKNTVVNTFNDVKNGAIDKVKSLWSNVKGFFINGYTSVKERMNLVKSGLKQIWTNIKDTAQDNITKMVNTIKNMPGRMAKALSNGKEKVMEGAKKLLNGLISGVEWGLNKVIGGVNKVMGWVGSETKIAPIEMKKYAKGTDGHPGGLAMVNDAKSSNYRELVQLPNGQSFVPTGRNVVMNLPRGSQVLDGNKTTDMARRGLLPHYNTGKGSGIKNLWQGTKNLASAGVNKVKGAANATINYGKDKFNAVKDWSTEVWDWVKSPKDIKALLMNIVGDKIPDKFTTGLVPSFIGGSVNKVIDTAKDWIFGKTESMGAGDTSITNKYGVYDFVYEIAKKIMGSKLGRGLSITSGQRNGDPHDHGSHNAIDLSGFGSNGGYKSVAKWASKLSGVGYTIGDNTVFGKKYGNGGTPSWATGHMNHLHVSGDENPRKTAGSDSVMKWSKVASQALKMTGQYSKNNLDRLLYQMKTESNGNQFAINNWDSNAMRGTPSKGLMQVIDPTFKTHAMKGYDSNIYDPLSNILASIRYATSRYGSLSSAYRGKGYANGGLITREHMAMVGEGNKPEMVIPLDRAKKGRAMQLLAQAQQYLGVNSKGNNSGGSSTTNKPLIDAILAVLQEVKEGNRKLEAIVNKNMDVVLDGKQIFNSVENHKNKQTIARNIAKGI